MKRYLVIVAALALALSACYVSAISSAQEQGEIEYTWGPVSSISSDRIVITEYDYDQEEEVDVTYIIGPEVVLKNVESLKDIKIGDSVEIEYVVENDTKAVKTISLDSSSYNFGE